MFCRRILEYILFRFVSIFSHFGPDTGSRIRWPAGCETKNRPVQVCRIPNVRKHRIKAMMICDWLGLRLAWIIMSCVER
jgi:hypothetical protein